MKVAEAYAKSGIDEIKQALNGAILRVYAGPQPETPENPLFRIRFLAEFVLSTPAFEGDKINPVESPVRAKDVGVPSFVRATHADDRPIADFSAGPGDMDVKLAETSCSTGAPVSIVKFQVRFAGGGIPERPLSPRDRAQQN
jgi:hypothetical protein